MAHAPDDRPPEAGAPDPRLTRLERLREARGWSFPRPVEGFAAATVAGFDPVGQVLGTTVAYLGPAGLGRCFVPEGGSRQGGAARTSADPDNRLLAKLRSARELALERAVAECRALGADGIIGVRVSTGRFFTDTVEFTVEGTAVRARAETHPETPFTTHVRGQDLARLLRSGWMPFALVCGMAIAGCHFEDTMYRQTRRGVGAAANREVSGYTRIANDARREARRDVECAVRQHGGAGAVVRDVTLRFGERGCPLPDQRLDYIAEAAILGSAITPISPIAPITPSEHGASARRAPLTVMRLDSRSPDAPSRDGTGPNIRPGPSLGDRAIAYWFTRHPRR